MTFLNHVTNYGVLLYHTVYDWTKILLWPRSEKFRVVYQVMPKAVIVSPNKNYLHMYLTIILPNRAEYRLILSRRGRRPSRLESDDITRD